ncbi:MAG: TetR/AcrR family transcriptional regulator [Actinomycetota bacterium]
MADRVKADPQPEAGDPATGTRHHILVIASDLFAIHGYHGTTTREIAEAVGIRQPSLFHHFPSKSAIMEALLEHDLMVAVPAAERIARSSGSAPARLYAYLVQDVEHLTTSDYNLTGVYTEEMRSSPEFVRWHSLRHRVHEVIETIVEDGRAAGDFLPFPAPFVREAILGILGRAIARHSGRRTPPDPRLPDDVSTVVLRGLLVDPRQMESVRKEGRSLGG